MGVADRVRLRQTAKRIQAEQQAAESPTGIQSTEVAAVEPDHIKRLKGVVYVLENFIKKNDNGMYGRMAFFMSTVTDELADELAELDEVQTRLFMYQIGEVISWIGHGDNARLPEAVQPFAEMVQPTGKADDSDTTPDGSSSHRELDS